LRESFSLVSKISLKRSVYSTQKKTSKFWNWNELYKSKRLKITTPCPKRETQRTF
jgi:hypothetical protein